MSPASRPFDPDQTVPRRTPGQGAPQSDDADRAPTPLGTVDVPPPPLIDLTALDLGGDVVFITDREGTILAVNDAFVQVTGFSRNEAIGSTPRLLSSGLQDEAFYRDLWDTVLQGRVWEGQLVDRHRDGRLRTHHATITPVLDGAGRVTHFVAVERDLTGELSRHAGVGTTGLVHLDASGRCVFADPRAAQLLGRSSDRLLGSGMVAQLRPDDADGLLEVIDRAMHTTRTHRLDVRLAANDRWLALEVQALTLASGAVAGVAVGVEDISERMAVHAELDRRDALTTSVLNSFGDPIAVMSGDGTVLSVNVAWRAAARAARPTVVPAMVGDDLLAIARTGGGEGEATTRLLHELHRIARGIDEPEPTTDTAVGHYRVTPLAWDDGGAVVRWCAPDPGDGCGRASGGASAD